MSGRLEAGLYVFVLATVLGFEVIRRVPKLLHTPLMALTNAISGVSLVGSLVVAGEHHALYASILGSVAVTASMINVVGGFVITDRMLRMFRTRAKKEPGGAEHPTRQIPERSEAARRAVAVGATIGAVVAAALLVGVLRWAASGDHVVTSTLTTFAYLVSGGAFVFALRWLTDPRTARRGATVGELGMLLAVIGTLVKTDVVSFQWIAVAALIGSAVGLPLALLTRMTAVPQMVALSHAFGALAAALVGTAEYYLRRPAIPAFTMSVLAVEVLLGFLTFTGSLMAFGKLQGLLPERPVVYRGQNVVNLGLLGLALAAGAILVVDPAATALFPVVGVLALAFGVLLIVPIGGSDMPTVVSLMNSYAGMAGAAMGFVLGNHLLVIAGALNGSSGLLLSIIMCRAMNRSFTNVLFGAFGQGSQGTTAATAQGAVKTTTFDEAAMLLDAATDVIVIPGYGMAAAQAQHKVAELAELLGKHGVRVRFAIHPVAGRMPGHMNVLLAEANVPYEQLVDMDQINDEFPTCDVAVVIGANDVVNPAARHDTASPIYGMPILDADRARCVVVVKRSMRSGFAGVDNELFYADNAVMLFGDAKQVVSELIGEVARLGGAVKLAA